MDRECFPNKNQVEPQHDTDLGSQRRSPSTCVSEIKSNGRDTKSTSQAKKNVDTSTVSTNQSHICYGDYTRKYPDLLNAYDLLTQSENKLPEENNDSEECNLSSDDLGSQRRFNISCSCLLYTSPSPRDRTRSRMPSSA